MMAGDSAAAMGPNPDTVAAALGMFCPIGPLLLVLIDPRRTTGNVAGRTFTMPGELEQAVAWVVERNAAGWNAYWTPNEARPMSNKSGKADMVRVRYFWADCDPVVFKHGGYDAARQHLMDETLPRLRARASFVIDSGHGLQAFWLLSGGMDLGTEEARNAFESLNDRLGAIYGSSGTHNCDRVMRIPGTINYPNAAKVTKGYPEAPTMARLLAADGTAWTAGEIAGEVTRAEIGARWDEVLAKHPAIRARWEGDTSGLRDTSGSGMDQSMVTMLCLIGWNLDDIRRALEHWKHGSVGGRQQGARHWDRMWKNAVKRRDEGAAVSLDMDAILSRPIAPPPDIDPALAEAIKPRPAPAAAVNTGADLMRLPGKQIQLAADWISGLFDSPTPAISTAGAIALSSVVTGRLYRSESANWTSLMMVIVGPSGVGKNYVKVGIERLLSRSGLDRLVAGDFYTHQSALYWALHQAPCHICISDEFGENFLEARKNNNANKMTVFKALKKVYSDADHIYKPESYSLAGLSKKQRDDSDTKPVINPSLSLLGLSTQRQFWTEIKASHIEGGLMNRMVIVNVDGQHRVRTVRGPDEPPTELVQWVGQVRRLDEPLRHTAFDLSPSSVFVEFSGQARRRFEEMRALQDARGDKLEQVGLGVMTRRWRENAMRMATGLASFEAPGSPVVSGDVADWACRYVHANGEATIDQLGANAGETDYAHQLNSVRAFVDGTGQRGATDYELKRGISHIRRRDLAELLAHLAEAGVITQIERKSDKGGRPTNAWVMAAGGEA